MPRWDHCYWVNESVFVKPRYVVEYGRFGLEGFDTLWICCRTRREQFRVFRLEYISFVYDCESKKNKRKIGISKNSEKKNRQISWKKRNRQQKKQNLSRPNARWTSGGMAHLVRLWISVQQLLNAWYLAVLVMLLKFRKPPDSWHSSLLLKVHCEVLRQLYEPEKFHHDYPILTIYDHC